MSKEKMFGGKIRKYSKRVTRGKFFGDFSETYVRRGRNVRITSLCMQRLRLVPPWLTHRHTQSHSEPHWPAILLAQPA